jgi:predicted TIM-barrel fold metal-dependent hydrolase
MVQVIDADGHVEESVAMFSRLEPAFQARRPIALEFDPDTAYGRYNAVWLIDGQVYPRPVGRGGILLGTPTLSQRAKMKPVTIPAQELTDVEARLRDLDAAGIDKQVVYPTLFLTTTTEDVKLEAAFYRAYNDFMAEARQRSNGRVNFAALVPIRDIQGAIVELRRAKEVGAVAVMFWGMAWEKTLDHEDLCPFYEEAARLDLPICLHFGWGCPGMTNLFEAGNSFNSATMPVLMGAKSILSSNVLEEIPNLRFAILETGSQWLPWMLHQIHRAGRARRNPAEYFREGRVYVACEADEDINYLTQVVGEDCFVVASDYPHGDPSHEDNLSGAIMAREDVPLRIREKILGENPARLYNL